MILFVIIGRPKANTCRCFEQILFIFPPPDINQEQLQWCFSGVKLVLAMFYLQTEQEHLLADVRLHPCFNIIASPSPPASVSVFPWHLNNISCDCEDVIGWLCDDLLQDKVGLLISER